MKISFEIFSRLLLVLCLLVLNSCTSPKKTHSIKKELVLVENQKALLPIIISNDASTETITAVDDLINYVEKISGVKLNKIVSNGNIDVDNAIWIGNLPEIPELFPEVDFNYKAPEEIIIAANTSHLVISGKDEFFNSDIKSKQIQYGTANAIYTFIQDYLGVKWLFPGEKGEYYPQKNKIAFVPFIYRYHPKIQARSGVFTKWSLDRKNSKSENGIWSKRQRVQLSSMSIFGGHAFTKWWKKYSNKHSNFFALQPNGTRTLVTSPKMVKLCQSNPDVWNTWLDEVEETIKKYPSRNVFSASPNDGWRRGHCTCNSCKSWDEIDMNNPNFIISDRHITFANKLARKLKEKYPEKKYFVQMHAYGLARPSPVKAIPDDNVIVSLVTNFLMRGDGVKDHRTIHMQYYEDWAKITSKIVWRPNIGNPTGHHWGLPDIAMHQAEEDFKFIAKNGCIGLFFDMIWGHWGTQGPQYYVFAQLAWNPYLDVDSLLNEYYLCAYGKGAQDMKLYWKFIESTRMNFVKEYKNKYRALDAPEVYTDDWFRKAFTYLENAKQKLNPVKDRKDFDRVEFVRDGLVYSKKVIDIRKSMIKLSEEEKLQSNSKKRKDILKKIENYWSIDIQSIKDTIPSNCINFDAVFKDTKNKRMRGLHPDNRIKGAAKRSYEKNYDTE